MGAETEVNAPADVRMEVPAEAHLREEDAGLEAPAKVREAGAALATRGPQPAG